MNSFITNKNNTGLGRFGISLFVAFVFVVILAFGVFGSAFFGERALATNYLNECGECKGGATSLTLKYNGDSDADIRIEQKKGHDTSEIYNAPVLAGAPFSFTGSGTGGNLKTEITIYVDGTENTKIHTSCSVDIYPGMIFGDFEVVDGSSKDNGPFCPLPEPTLGSINICKVIIDGEGNLTDGSENDGTFRISGLDFNNPDGVLPTSLFLTPLSFDTDLFSQVEGDDARCYVYDNLPLGSYYYGEEEVTGENWETPKYNDQNSSVVEDFDDFFLYSDELFNNDGADDGNRNTNSDGHLVLTENRPERTLVILNQFTTPLPKPTTIHATKVVCDAEEYLPNWGAGGSDITETTATDWVAQSDEHCELAPDWQFEWGYQNVTNPGDTLYGVAGGDWNTFGLTDSNGVATVEITDLQDSSHLWMREVLKEGFIPFTFGENGNTNIDDESAEIYCGSDVLNYDNFDRIDNIALDETFYCVAFNTTIEPEFACNSEENLIKNGGFETPELNSSSWDVFYTGEPQLEWSTGENGVEIQNNVAGAPYAGEQHAELDPHHVTSIWQEVTTEPGHTYRFSTQYSPRPGRTLEDVRFEFLLNGSTLGASVARDGQGNNDTDWTYEERTFVATDALTTVGFVETGLDTSFGAYLDDVGLYCDPDPTPNEKPIIYLTGDPIVYLFVDETYNEQGATADDAEDGNDLPVTNIDDNEVDTSTTGTYIVYYNFTDSGGLPADQVTREVIVAERPSDNTCPFEAQTGRIIIDFLDGDKIRSDTSDTFSGPVSTTVLAGTYTVNLASFDGYTNRVNVTQPYEIWKLELADNQGVVAVSDPTTDLEDEVAYVARVDIVNANLVVSSDVTEATARHAAIGFPTANSVEPVCAALDLVVVPPENLKQCEDNADNDGDNLVDEDDPGCHSDGDPNNPSSYEPKDDDEKNKVPYAPYCGDGIVNQEWEACDGSDFGSGPQPLSVVPQQCTAQCQTGTQCIELALAKVTVDEFETFDNGNFVDDMYLGSDTNRIPAGAWFALYWTGWTDTLKTYETDADVSGYEDVPGFAVQRSIGDVRVVLHGSQTSSDKESAKGTVEFWNIDAESATQDTGNNKLEGNLNVLAYSMPGNDYLKFIDATRIDYAISVNTADDGFFSNYSDVVPMCTQPNTPPSINLLGDNPQTVDLFGTYNLLAAEAIDVEDDDTILTAAIVVGGNTVDTNTVGTYFVTYDVTDSGGLDANTVTRTVNVVDNRNPTECNDDKDNDGDETIDEDDPGCWTDPEDPKTYDPNDDDENEKPVITLRGDNPQTVTIGGTYGEASADVDDPEDGDIDGKLVIDSSALDTNTLGSYLVTYNATDTDNVAADEVIRTVDVVEAPQCSDDKDNDGDETTDEDDPGCWTDPEDPQTYDPNDDDENEKPVITLTGDETIDVIKDNIYSEQGATADDSEDGNDLPVTDIDESEVDTSTLGTYTVYYNFTDSDGEPADEVTRTVNVIEDPEEVPGCTDSGATNYDSSATKDDGSCNFPPPPPTCVSNCGGGGGGHVPNNLTIFNEKITVIGSGTALITWNTNKPATSRVVYDDDTHSLGVSVFNFGGGSDDLGYEFTTDLTSSLVSEHSVLVTNVNLEDLFYFRPVSSDGTRAIGIELQAILGVITGGSCEQYLFEFIRFGDDNNPAEVRKLQLFLNEFEENDLDVNGVYDQATFDAVVAFQNKYNGDVLSPWGLQTDTGYVYLTTRKKINEIYCNFQLAFPLTDSQLSEVNSFKALLESLEAQGLPLPDTSNVGVGPSGPTFAGVGTSPTVILTEETTDEDDEGDDEGGTDSLAAAIEALENGNGEGGFFSRIGNFFRNMFR